MTEEQLDERCEAYLESRFHVRIDFAISQSLVALVDDGIVRRDSQVRIRAGVRLWLNVMSSTLSGRL